MKAASIKIKKGIANAQVMSPGEGRSRILRFLFLGLAALAFLYALFLGKMVFNIVERRSLDDQARVLQNEVSQLDLAYLASSDKIDLALSHSLGFQDVSPTYAVRKALGSAPTAKNEI